MTDLERVREYLLSVEAKQKAWVNEPSLLVADLDAHLKEDAERELKHEAALVLQADVSHALSDELTELREVVREAERVYGPLTRRLRQLIEEKE